MFSINDLRKLLLDNLNIWKSKLESSIPKTIVTANPNGYQDLTPQANVVKTKTYCDALKWALDNDAVNNIALTGPYGSGKSSIIKALEDAYPEFHYLNISLASFADEQDMKNESSAIDVIKQELEILKAAGQQSDYIQPDLRYDKKVNQSKKDKRELHQLVELSILQQIFYRETDKTLPQSRFKRIKKLKFEEFWFKPAFLILWAITGLYSGFLSFRSGIQAWIFINDQMQRWIMYIGSVFFVTGLLLILTSISKYLYNAKFTKLNLKGGEIEINPNIDKSILNKHLDEILYFFEVTPYNVVTIEDLDRFNDPEIFTKLRELNLLINNAKQVGRHVRFLYALKDDMFTNKNRTKFFDFIVPVVPVINASNSIDLLLPKLKAVNLKDALSKKFLYDITLYIDEMRVLNNVFNEFMLYRERLTGVTLIDEKLFGMIVYKNVHPNDFANLHVRKGYIYKAINSKSEIVGLLLKEKFQKIAELEEKLSALETEFISDMDDLRAIYVQAAFKLAPNVVSISTDKAISLVDLGTETGFNQLISATKFTLNYHQEGYTSLRLDVKQWTFKNLERLVDPNRDFAARANVIKDKSENLGEKHRVSLQKLKREVNEMRSLSMKDLLLQNRSAIDYFPEKLKKKKLLIYLLRGGYIDEMYDSYIAPFYDQSLTTADMEFLRCVRNRVETSFDYGLTNVEELIHRLSPEDFMLEELLNFQLVDIVFAAKERFYEEYEELIDQLAHHESRALKFIEQYIEIGKSGQELLLVLAEKWPAFWKYIVLESEYSETKKNYILITWMKYSDIEIIKQQNVDESLRNYIAQLPNFLTLIPDTEYQEKVFEVIKALGVYFTKLNNNQSRSPLFDEVYNNDYYAINEHMIELIVFAKGNGKATSMSLQVSNFTSILASGCETLQGYIDEYMEDYVDDLVLLENNTHESENSVVKLLKKTIREDQRSSIIETQEIRLPDIKDVHKDYWDLLLEHDRIEISWYNLYNYYENSEEINDLLAAYINDEMHATELSNFSVEKEKGIEQSKLRTFVFDLFTSKTIKDKTRQHLINSVTYQYVDDASIIETATETTLNLMVRHGNLPLNIFNYNTLRAHHHKVHLNLVVQEINLFLKTLTDFELDSAENLFLQNSSLSEKQKLRLIEFIPPAQLLDTKKLAEQVLPRLVRFSQRSKQTSTIINLITSTTNTQNHLKLFLLNYSNLSIQNKVDILTALKSGYELITHADKQPTFDDIPIHVELLDKLVEDGIITKYFPFKNKLRISHSK